MQVSKTPHRGRPEWFALVLLCLVPGTMASAQNTPPAFTTQPQSQIVKQSSNVTLSVAATGTAPLVYQWFFNDATFLPNATNSSLTLSNVQPVNEGGYSVVVANGFGAITSQVATLTLLVRPAITMQPQSVTVVVGEEATFSVTVTNSATRPITYQWRKGSLPLTNLLLNATTSSFTLYNVQTNVTATSGPGSYRVAISNAATAPTLLGSLVVNLVVVPPIAAVPSTGAASEIAGDGATLNGAVNPNGSTTLVRFDYGLTDSYGGSTATLPVGHGTNFVSVSLGLADLMPATTYHYRMVSSNSAGITNGEDRTFTTADTPVPSPLATTSPLANVMIVSAVLNGSVNPNGGYAAAYFEYGLTAGYGNRTPTNLVHGNDSIPVSQAVTGLSADTMYHYRAVAFNFAGPSFGADETFQTLPQPPAVTLPVSLVTSTFVVLSGSVNPLGIPKFAHFDYGLTTNYGSSTAPIDVGIGLDPILVSNVVAGLLSYRDYHFRMVAVSAAGVTYGSDETFRLAETQQLNFTTLAGDGGGAGASDGIGSDARFWNPVGVAADSAGNVYVADSGNFIIRKIAPGGVVSTLAGLSRTIGCADGTGSAARFRSPEGVAVDSAGNVYVADAFNSTIRKITPGGVVSTLAGLAGSPGNADGTGSAARFDTPEGVAVDGAGNVYVANTGSSTIRKITPSGVVSTLAGLARQTGASDGTGSAARFNNPWGVAVDGVGNVYVADYVNSTIRKITPNGVVSTLAGLAGNNGAADGTGNAARFFYPRGVAVDSAGNVYVADSSNLTIRKITPSGEVSTLAGQAGSPGSADGTGNAARFYTAWGVAVDSTGKVYVADEFNHTIREISPGGVVSTLAGRPSSTGSADGLATAARFYEPSGVAADSAGTVYVADTWNSTIRKITPGGLVSTLAGLVGSRGSADGTGSAARFANPAGLAVDNDGNIYVADLDNSTIRKITPGGTVSTLAGLAGNTGSADGMGSAARFFYPQGLAVDTNGTVYVADVRNSTIRKITPDGMVSTLAGLAGVSGTNDGTGVSARFNWPLGVAVDNAGTVFVTDSYNFTIRKITPAGVVSTVAGQAGSNGTTDGTGSVARFDHPFGLAVDNSGSIYVADFYNATIRKITPAGEVGTVGGVALNFGSADGTGSAARFNAPHAVAVDNAGNIYVADTENHKIRKGSPEIITIGQPPASQTVLEGGAAAFHVEVSSTLPLSYQWRFNGTNLANADKDTLALNPVTSNQAGDYLVVISSAFGSVTSGVAGLTVIGGPHSLGILLQPQSQTVNPGATVTLSVSATGNPPPSFQWRRNGVNIPGAVNPTLTLTDVQPTDGGRYSVIVSSLAGAGSSEAADLVISSPGLPFADNFANRVLTNSLSGVGSGSNTNATKEPGEPNHAGKVGGRSVWYSWQAPANGIATFSTLGSAFDTLLAVYTGSSLNTLTVVASDDDRAGFLNSQVAFKAVAGVVYSVAIDGFAGGSGNIVLSWNLDTTITDLPRFITQPLSQTVTNGANVSFSVVIASQTAPSYQWFYNCDLIPIANNPTANSATLIVTNVQPPSVGSYTVRVLNAASREVQSLPAFLEIGRLADVRSKDKLEDLYLAPDGSGFAAGGGKGGSGSAVATANSFVPVSAGTLNSQVLNNFGATTSPGETNHCGIIGGASKWFGLTPTADATFIIDTIGSSIDTVVAVYTNDPGNLLSPLYFVACDNDGAPDRSRSLVRFPARGGQDYLVAVDGVNAAQGVISLNWRLGTGPAVSQSTGHPLIRLGANASLSVDAGLLNPLPIYLWFLNGARLFWATNATINLGAVTPGAAGTYTVVVSNFIGSVTSTVATVTVEIPLEVTYELTEVAGEVRFRVRGTAGQPVVLQSSSDLQNWTPAYTNATPNAPFDFPDPNPAAVPVRFYRAVPWP